MSNEYTLEVPSYGEKGFNALELSDFILKFRAAYVVATWFVEYETSTAPNLQKYDVDRFAQALLQDRLPELVEKFHVFIRTQRGLGTVASLSHHRLDPSEDLAFNSITTNSPLKFIGYCTGTALVALALAVALSGGEADIKNMKFTVQPMADSIVKIARELRR